VSDDAGVHVVPQDRPPKGALYGEVIVVVAAVIERDGAFLVTRRQKGVHLAGLWEFPGGKIDEGETHAAALVREIREELDTDVDVGDLVFEVTHTYDDLAPPKPSAKAGRTVALYFYRCTLRGTPRPLLGQEMRWVPRADLATLGFPPADEELIKRLTESRVR
jgi:8-oxo-dGTP diphosphatase